MSSKIVVDFKALIILRESPEFPQKWEIFSRVLKRRQVRQIMLFNLDGMTFCACWATINTSEKSYIPRAMSKSLSASTRNITYFTASSTRSGCESEKRSLVLLRVTLRKTSTS